MADNNTDGLAELEIRIKELNDKFSQTLLFLSFALVVLATLKEKSNSSALQCVATWWSLSLFPILMGILPLKEWGGRKESWYCFVRYFKVTLLWVALIIVGFGAWDFFIAIIAGSFR